MDAILLFMIVAKDRMEAIQLFTDVAMDTVDAILLFMNVAILTVWSHDVIALECMCTFRV